MRFLGLHIDHPGYAERRSGAKSTVSLAVDRGLKSGKTDSIPLTEDDLLRMLEEAARYLRILRKKDSDA